MKNITCLDERQCQVLRGGFWSTYYSTTKFSGASTTINQTNSTNNLGVGLLIGLGNAQSLQGNGAEAMTFIL